MFSLLSKRLPSSACADYPCRSRRDHALGTIDLRQRLPQRLPYLRVEMGRAVALEAQDLAGWAQVHRQVDRLLHVVTRRQRKIAPPQRDVLVAGAHQDSAGGV